MPWSWTGVLWWGGLRGGICMVLALSLAPDFPHRDLLVTMTFGVVTLIILLHGFTMAPVLGRLGLTRRHEAREEYELTRGRLHVAQRALKVIDEMTSSGTTDPDLLEDVREEYRKRVREGQERLRTLHVEHADLRAGELSRALRQVLLAERRQATEAYRSGLLSQEVYERLAADIDARLLEVREEWDADASDEGEAQTPGEHARAVAGEELAPDADEGEGAADGDRNDPGVTR
jgi:CPA1 family monovalent cation:H+ antiporter